MIRPLRPVVALWRDIPCENRRPHKPDAVGVILVTFGLFYLVYAFSLTGDRPTERTREGLVVALAWLPFPAWAALWALAGLTAIGSAFLVGPRPGPIGFTAAWVPPMGWALWYVLGVVFVHADARGIVTAFIFAAFAFLAFACARVVDPRTIGATE